MEPLAEDLQEHLGRSRGAVGVLRELSLWLRSDECEKAWAVAADAAGFSNLAGKERSPPKVDYEFCVRVASGRGLVGYIPVFAFGGC